MTVKFAINNKIHSATKVSLLMVDYSREMKMGADIRKKKRVEKTIEFTERMKRV